MLIQLLNNETLVKHLKNVSFFYLICYNLKGEEKMAKKVKNRTISNENEVAKLVKLIIIVTLIFVAFYVLTILVNKKDVEETPSDDQASVQYDEILIGNIFKQPNAEYYVMIYDDGDYNASVYSTYLGNYSAKENAIRVYTAKLGNYFNQIFKAEQSVLNTNDVDKLKFKGSTLLKIKDGKIESSYEGDKITDYLKEISKEETE